MKKFACLLMATMLSLMPVKAIDNNLYIMPGVITEIYDDGYAKVVDENENTWAVEIDPDAEVGEELVLINSDENTEDPEDDLTVLTVSRKFYDVINTITVDSITGYHALLKVNYADDQVIYIMTDNFKFQEGQILLNK